MLFTRFGRLLSAPKRRQRLTGALLSLVAFALLLAGNLAAESRSFDIDLSGFDPHQELQEPGWGALTAPGYPRLPGRSLNILLPAGAKDISYSASFYQPLRLEAPAPEINSAFSDGEQSLDARPAVFSSPQVTYCGTGRWGDLLFARFRVLPAIWTGKDWICQQKLHLELNWSASPQSGRIPPVIDELGREKVESFFVNPQDLPRWYAPFQSRSYDYLIVSTPSLYAAVSALENFRQSQGLATSFADISTILADGTGNSPGEKLRNHLISEYNAHPFSYLLLVGDHDTVPLLKTTPTPNGSATVPSDFYYGDLSSILDSDGDGRLGEYYSQAGEQDWLCDYTPEVLVGRISTNDAVIAAQIAARTVAYDQSQSPWKQSALLAGAWLNFPGQPLIVFAPTDGASQLEHSRQTVLTDWNCTTLYERQGIMPSYPSDHPLGYNSLKSQLSANSFGLLNWSAHGSYASSIGKYWREDPNGNQIADSGEMTGYTMVNKATFDGLANPDGLIIFAASCYNGMLDTSYTTECLAEYALAKKAVNVIAATRTGWYKVGWQNPGWGGLGSYNHLFVENLARNRMSCGAALAWANLTHTQYFLFGDPLDDGGIIYPELQNVYTYLLFGDPAVGRGGWEQAPLAEILVYEPTASDGLPVVEALGRCGRFNVIYTDKLIPDYDYIGRFAAVFCLFGWGNDAYTPQPDSLDHALLSSYLAGGGSIYLEGDVDWDAADPFWQSFGTTVGQGTVIIENLGCDYAGQDVLLAYAQSDPETYLPLPALPGASVLFSTINASHPDHPVAIYHSGGSYRCVASAFALKDILDLGYNLEDALGVILDTLDVLDQPAVFNSDPAPPLAPQALTLSAGADGLLLNWDPVTLNTRGQPIVPDRYAIFSSADPCSGFTWLGESFSPGFTDSSAPLTPRRFYKVLAIKDYPQPQD